MYKMGPDYYIRAFEYWYNSLDLPSYTASRFGYTEKEFYKVLVKGRLLRQDKFGHH